MKDRQKTIVTILALLLFAGGASLANELPRAFIPTPVFTNVTGLSGDGKIATGGNAVENFYWTEEEGFVFIGGIGLASGGLARVSADGSTIVGSAEYANGNDTAGIWLGGTNWQLLGGLSASGCPNLSSVYGLSHDGSTVVGLGWDGCGAHGFSWTEQTGMVDLGELVPNTYSRANQISDDAHVIVGWNDTAFGERFAAKWVDHVEEWIKDGDTHLGAAQATNRDGSIIVGGVCSDPDGAWIWTDGSGVECVGFPGADNVIYDTNDDGNVMGGWWSSNPAFRDGVVYFNRKPKFLAEHLLEYGITDAQDWQSLGGVLAVSSNGRVIGGWGLNADGFQQGYIVKLGIDPPPLTVSASGSVAQLDWEPVSAAVGYDVVRGSLGVLRATGGDFQVATEQCLVTNDSSTMYDDPAVPDPGEAFWYVIRPQGETLPGSWDTDVLSQRGTRDNGIDTSENSCNQG